MPGYGAYIGVRKTVHPQFCGQFPPRAYIFSAQLLESRPSMEPDFVWGPQAPVAKLEDTESASFQSARKTPSTMGAESTQPEPEQQHGTLDQIGGPSSVHEEPPEIVSRAGVLLSRLTAFPPAAGRASLAIENWRLVTDDQWVLQTVLGYRIPFVHSPVQHRAPPPIHLNCIETAALDEELRHMQASQAIEPAHDARFLSTHFVTQKANGKWRPIFNLKDLNAWLDTQHFKMESFAHVADLLRDNMWLGRIPVDLKDAYHSIRIHPASRPYLAFTWQGETWQYRCLPFGLSEAPRTFTKVLRPVAGWLRQRGFHLVVYLDDWLLMAESPQQVTTALTCTMYLLESLGFTINKAKSVLEPTQSLVFLGVEIHTTTMQFSLPAAKLQKIRKECRRLRNNGVASEAELRSLVGKMVAARSALAGAMLQVRSLQRQMLQGRVTLSRDALGDLTWWIDGQAFNSCPVRPPAVTLMIQTDASNYGWGAVCNGRAVGGRWLPTEQLTHINWKELMAALLGLKVYASHLRNTTVALELDNVTAVAYINHQGGTHSHDLCVLATKLWLWAMDRQLHLIAKHIAGKTNVHADFLSRHSTDSGDLRLNPEAFQFIWHLAGPFSRDLFASRHNAQMSAYISWMADPDAENVDAFSVASHRWEQAYAFPPFALVSRCLQFVQRHSVQVLTVVAPAWRHQVYYPLLLDLSVAPPHRLSNHQFSPLLLDPEGQPHPLAPRLALTVWRISGNVEQARAFRRRLQTSGCRPGVTVQTSHMNQPGVSGYAGVSHGGLDPVAGTAVDVANFLASQFDAGKQYRTLNVYRSALSSTLPSRNSTPVGQDQIVTRLMSGVYHERPPQPKYSAVWDVTQVLSFLSSWPRNEALTVNQLTLKLTALMALAKAPRVSELRALDVSQRQSLPDGVLFRLAALTKTQRTGEAAKEFFLPSFTAQPHLCPVQCLHEYVSRTSTRRTHVTALFISTRSPYQAVTTSTIARWLKAVLDKSGIDMTIFSAHSTRGAAATAASAAGVSLADILATADWSHPSTFVSHYYRPQSVVASNTHFSDAVLRQRNSLAD